MRTRLRGLIQILAFLFCATAISNLFAEEVNLRLRLAWGSGDSAKHRWIGRISCPGAKLSNLQPLGIEADAPVAILLDGNELVINPWEKRGFDGCDITVAGDTNALMRFELRSEQATVPKVVEVSLGELVRNQIREPIDSLGSFLLVYRCPGDRFRVVPTRENLIFAPGEVWSLRLKTDFAAELKAGPVVIDAVVRAVGNDQILWQWGKTISPDSPVQDELVIDVPCPTAEGGYRLSINARTEEGFASRFVPGQAAKPFAKRELDLVVIDPAGKMPALTDSWIPILSIDPANPSWWQRLPTWAQVSRLTGKPPGSLGNVRLLPHAGQVPGLVELAPSASKQDLSWQSFSLPIQEVGVPHLIEITYPLSLKQDLGASIIEPDASGRVTATVVDTGFKMDEMVDGDSRQLGTHRLLFWPRTQSPQLLLTNHSATQPAVFGLVTLSRHNDAASTEQVTLGFARSAACYIAKPVFAQSMGAPETLDPASGMSVQSWSTFLDGARRLTQYLRLRGYNSALVSVAADGSAIYPSEHLVPSPRYDTGQMAASGQDPHRKDVLEMLCRIFDRDGIKLIPTIQLATPLPKLESLRNTGTKGITWVDRHGRELLEAKKNSATLAANYNLLNPTVQQEVSAVVLEIAERYGRHPMLSAIALQLDSNGFGVLPGLEWGFDDQTLELFSSETGTELPRPGERTPQQLSELLLEVHRTEWQAWRVQKLTDFYRSLADQVRARRPDLTLILTTENLFSEDSLEQAVRAAGSDPARIRELLSDRGIDLMQLASLQGVELTNAGRPFSDDQLQEQVTDFVINDLTQRGELLAPEVKSANLLFQKFEPTWIPSFDERSPYGPQHTRLLLAHHKTSAGPNRHLLTEMFNTESTRIIEGGEYPLMTIDSDHTRRLRAWSQLPVDLTEVRTLSQQPVTVSTLRNATETFVTWVNESPWHVSAELEVESSQMANWEELGTYHASSTSNASAQGRVPTGRSKVSVELAPNDLRVWKFDTTKLRPVDFRVAANPAARDYLARRIQEIESRTGNLNIEREFTQLQNPGFELDEGTTRIFGWQPLKGINGSVELNSSNAHSGSRSLGLKSDDHVGVSAQSHLFPVPATGMLVVKAHVRVNDADRAARMLLALESEDPALYRRVQSITLDADSRWKEIEFVANDLPVGDADQLRVAFHVAGRASVLVDDIVLYDLRFDEQRRTELVKLIFSARAALDENQFADCLRLLNEYWPRYLVQYVPPADHTSPTLAKQPDPTSPKTEEKPKGRMRGWMPRLFR